ncbi:MAG: site-2 protease family protein [Clostridia bacterium]|nr:site-2 protease family protein [Clostridia bacterium]
MFLSRLRMYLSMLRTDPLEFLVYILCFAVAILTSLILHECAHGFVAYKCGDPTAKYMGRLSLDPRKHLDPIGTISMILLGIGWAKPVPVNPRNYRNYRRDDILVSMAGIVMNLCLFVLSTFLLVLQARLGGNYANWGIGMQVLQEFLRLLAQINVSLAVFNFLPIPPLDGYHLFNDILFRGRFQLNRNTFQIAQIVLLILCLSGALSGVLGTVNSALYNGMLNVWIRVLW